MSEGQEITSADVATIDQGEDPHPVTGQPQVHPVELESPQNTERQIEAARRADEQWEKERSYPLFKVDLTGDDVEWVPRADERYWRLQDSADPDSGWVPLPAEELLKVGVSLSENGSVLMQARCSVTLLAPNEEAAKAKALADNLDQGYHTVASVTKVRDGQE